MTVYGFQEPRAVGTMSLTSLSLIIIIILMEGAGALVIHKSKNHMVIYRRIRRPRLEAKAQLFFRLQKPRFADECTTTAVSQFYIPSPNSTRQFQAGKDANQSRDQSSPFLFRLYLFRCECDATAGSACIFSTINSKKQWVFTCQKASQTEANQEGPVRVSFKYFMDQYRQLKKG